MYIQNDSVANEKNAIERVTSPALSRPFAFALQNSFVMSDRFPGLLPISLRLIGVMQPHNPQRTPKDNRKSWTSS